MTSAPELEHAGRYRRAKTRASKSQRRLALALMGLLLPMGIFAPAHAARAEAAVASMATPVKAVKATPICQRIVRCAGCKPVYRCRVCRKRPICTHGVCIYRTICGWGPALNALPKGARVVKVR